MQDISYFSNTCYAHEALQTNNCSVLPLCSHLTYSFSYNVLIIISVLYELMIINVGCTVIMTIVFIHIYIISIIYLYLLYLSYFYIYIYSNILE